MNPNPNLELAITIIRWRSLILISSLGKGSDKVHAQLLTLQSTSRQEKLLQ